MIVKDDALMRKIDEGERFGKVDAIRVKMKRYAYQRYARRWVVAHPLKISSHPL